MGSFLIEGGSLLEGKCRISGAKNAVLPIMAAGLLCGGKSRLLDCPELTDVEAMLCLLESLGCVAERRNGEILLDTGRLTNAELTGEFVTAMRASIFLVGPLLARCGEASFRLPGGCPIGARPVDLHLDGFRRLGAEIRQEGSILRCRAKRLVGAEIRLAYPSVGATENLMMAATLAEGETSIRNAAREPEIEDLQCYLQACGAIVEGAGTGEIRIRGVPKLIGAEHRIAADRIQAGTLLLCAAVTGGSITLERAKGEYLRTLLELLRSCGCRVWEDGERICLHGPERLKAAGYIETGPYPEMPTDLQSPLLAVMCLAQGTTYINETVFENRFRVVEELRKMGADIVLSGNCAKVRGRSALTGAAVMAPDLRGGAALVIAGLAAKNETMIENVCLIDRGYDKLEVVLSNLGAKMKRIGEEPWGRQR